MNRENRGEGKKRYEALKDQYPMIFAFGEGKLDYLSHADSLTATVGDRIKSVWPFLVRQVLRFAATLKARDFANYDPEDVLSELWITLVERDDKWEPARGRYLTFAGRVVTNELHAIRDRSHTVHAPKNTSCRLKQYQSEDDADRLSDRRRKTFTDILRVLGEQEAMAEDPASLSVPSAADQAVRAEEKRYARHAVKWGLGGLTARESQVLGKVCGLFGRHETSVAEVARSRGVTPATVHKVLARAMGKVRTRIEDAGLLED